MNKALPLAVIAALVGLLLWMWYDWHPVADETSAHRALELAERPTGGNFRLHAADGPVELADLHGKVVLIYFGYTWCPDICPTNLGIMALALRGLTPDELEQVQALFVSVDPQRDTPERLRDYAAYFHPAILGVTGTESEIAEAAKRYGAAYRRAEQPDSAMGYIVDHSAYTYVVDPAGRLVATLDHATPSETLLSTIRQFLPSDG
jgi:protein SCO1/2